MSARHEKLGVEFVPNVNYSFVPTVDLVARCWYGNDLELVSKKFGGKFLRPSQESIVGIANDQIDKARESVESGE